MPLLSIVYVSAARPDFHRSALSAMLDRAKVRNASLDITGCLLHYDGSFMQVLEGPADNLLQVYRSIRADPRHHRLVELHHAALAQRAFSDWSMQLAQPGEAAWNALYRMAQARTDVDSVTVLRPLLSSFLISGDRYQAFRA